MKTSLDQIQNKNYFANDEFKIVNGWLETSAPSNIALIKYMGKVDTINNLPTNDSLSYTLDHLKTFVRIRPLNEKNNLSHQNQDTWHCFERSDLRVLQLSEKGLKKFLTFFQVLKEKFNLTESFAIESANNFPSDCGLASSASSFAALTKAAYFFALSQNKIKALSCEELAMISQKGSGSSCRSFFTPWSVWNKQGGAIKLNLSTQNFHHMVILCDEKVKTVSSSEAHKKIVTSDLFFGRPERAEKRLQELVKILSEADLQQKLDLESANSALDLWNKAVQICWNEFWDMHNLFHTSVLPFGYLNGLGLDVLISLREMWAKQNMSPLVTMDAGSNIHLLFHQSQNELYQNYKHKFNKLAPIWSDEGYSEINSI